MPSPRAHDPRAYSLPRAWLLTDPRLESSAVVPRLPKGVGVIVRDYDHPNRLDHCRKLIAACKARGHAVLIAGDPGLARTHRADGVHCPERMVRPYRRPFRTFYVTAAAHSIPALIRAQRCGVDAIFLSPLFATRSHPHQAPLGRLKAAAWIRYARRHQGGRKTLIFALGGVSPRTRFGLAAAGFSGWGAIDGWTSKPPPQ